MKDNCPNLGHSHAHNMTTVQAYDTPNPKAICPLCGKYMSLISSFYAGVIECNMYTWHCPKCDIRREQAQDAAWFNPQVWHRVHYNFGDSKDVYEDEEGFAERVKAEQEKRGLKPVRVDTTPRNDILLSMTNEEAIRILENVETDIYGRIAIAKAIDALKGETG